MNFRFKKVYVRLLFIYCIAVVSQSCIHRIDRVNIEGYLSGSPKSYIYINRFNGDALTFIDSVKTNSHGHFSTTVSAEDSYFLTIGASKKHSTIILLIQSGEELTIRAEKDDLSDYKVFGSNGSTLIYELTQKLSRTKSQIDSLQKTYKLEVNNPKIDSIKTTLDSTYNMITRAHRNYTISFIKNNPFSPASILALFQAYDTAHPVLEYSKDQKLFRLIDSTLRTVYSSNSLIRNYHLKIHNLDSLYHLRNKREMMFKVGETLPDVGYPLIGGDNLFASGIWFKYILVDFWSDWCDTCIENTISLKAIYKEFGPKGLVILQVSLGANPDSLKNRIAQDSLFWYHASIDDYQRSKILDTLKISSIPSNYITDRRGSIKGVNLWGLKLKEKLSELLH